MHIKTNWSLQNFAQGTAVMLQRDFKNRGLPEMVLQQRDFSIKYELPVEIVSKLASGLRYYHSLFLSMI